MRTQRVPPNGLRINCPGFETRGNPIEVVAVDFLDVGS